MRKHAGVLAWRDVMCILVVVPMAFRLRAFPPRGSHIRPSSLRRLAATARFSHSSSSLEKGPVTIPLNTLRTDHSSDFVCSHCATPFASRNALFRHLRTDSICSIESINTGNIQCEKQSIAIKFAYHDLEMNTTKTPLNVAASTKIQALLMQETSEFVESVLKIKTPNNDTTLVKWISDTQTSVTKNRHFSLAQESVCAAAADVMVATLQVPQPILTMSDSWEKILQRVQRKLTEDDSNVRMVACKTLDDFFNVERECSQRSYRYLVPALWLPNGTEIQSWWLRDDFSKDPLRPLKKSTPTPEGLRVFKAALKTAESSSRQNGSSNSVGDDKLSTHRWATGRYGVLGLRQRRPWHNFADPNLRGDASPSNEPVWKVMDRCRIVGCYTHDNQNVSIVVEFSADDFVLQQVRRLVGTAVAISHGWLPADFVEQATQPTSFIPTPLAPPNLMYNAGNRFHFEELKWNGQDLFETNQGGHVIKFSNDPEPWIQERLMKAKGSSFAKDLEWLRDLETKVAPHIRKYLASTETEHEGIDLSMSQSTGVAPPKVFRPALSILREIVSHNKWPNTTSARSTVIATDAENTLHSNRGSFTIVNTKAYPDIHPLPLANQLFPTLVDEIFELESVLSQEYSRDRILKDSTEDNVLCHRPPSSHCAVNCNAQFTPHVDSGKGAGQRLSMIVGLGNYTGGEIVIEGQAHGIAYQPVEFDGWKLRHWTNPFQGERFSLVWFTPEQSVKQQES